MELIDDDNKSRSDIRCPDGTPLGDKIRALYDNGQGSASECSHPKVKEWLV